MLTLVHGPRVVYKYGGSDTRLNALGGMPFLFWKIIQDAKQRGAYELDLGRSDCDDSGLIAFKEHLGAHRSPLTYWRSPAGTVAANGGRVMQSARRAFLRLPGAMRRPAARFLYRHLG